VTRVLLAHPGSELYGSDRMAVATVSSLADLGIEVCAIVPQHGALIERLEGAGARVVELDLPVLRKSQLRPAALLRLVAGMPLTLARAAAAIRRARADVVYVNTITQPWWILAARLVGARVIVHVREAESDVPDLMKRALLLPLAIADVIPCNSRATEEYVLRYSAGTAGRTAVLYNGKDWSEYTSAAPARFEAPVRLTLVGRLSPRKGTDTAVEALAILRKRGYDVRLALVGDVFPGYEWFADQLRSRALALGLSDSIDFAGFTDDPAAAFANSDIALVPSRVEPFGTVAAEAMASARCTVVARTQGLVEIVDGPEVGSTFDPGDAAGLADACASLIDSPQRAAAIALAGRELIVERFSSAGYAQGTAVLVRKAMEGRR